MRGGPWQRVRRSWAFSAIVATVLASCSQRATWVTVVLDTNARERVQALRIRTSRGASLGADAASESWGIDASATRRAAVAWPATFAVLAARGSMEAAGTSVVSVEVEVDYAPMRAGQPVSTARRGARFSFLPRTEGVVRLVLNDSCASLVAPPAQCRAGSEPCTLSRYCEEQSPAQTCGDDGRCVALDVTPVTPTDAGTDASDSRADGGDAARSARLFFAQAAASPQWTEVAASGEGPTSAVRAAFTVPGAGELNVLTASELFVLRTSDRRWIERHALSVALASLDPTSLWEIAPMPGSLAAPVVFVPGAPAPIAAFDSRGIHHFEWTQSTRRGTFVRTDPYDGPWTGAGAPPRWDVLAVYYAPHNREGWVPNATTALCGRTTIGEHMGVLSWDGFGPRALVDTVFDVPCAQFVGEGLYGSRPPFAAMAAFDPWSIRGAAWDDGLWLVTD